MIKLQSALSIRSTRKNFIYEAEFSEKIKSGFLTRLDLALMHDQSEKIHAQARMMDNGVALFDWLEEGGHFYVCGDVDCIACYVD